MDPRIREHAQILVEHSTAVQAGDNVVIRASAVAEPLIEALHRELGARQANPVVIDQSDRYRRALLTGGDPGRIALHEHLLALMERTDVYIAIGGALNRAEASDIEPTMATAFQRAQRPILEERLTKRWVGTQFPSPDAAQSAEMSTTAYEDFVYGAVSKDWAAQRELQAELVDRLNAGEEARIVSGEATDLTMSIDGMIAINDYAKHNLPGGEVFTAPVPDSVEGRVVFDMPVISHGREIVDASLVFEGGAVVEHDASKNEALLSAVLETDPGARRLGELGIGMNRDIDRFTYNMLFDEKMGDTVHLALGRAYVDNVPADRERNESAIHLDMIVDMSADSRIEIDGEVVQRDGAFVFE